jgi:hypothetical protein
MRGRWFWDYGPTMIRTTGTPLSYTQTDPSKCGTFESHGGGPEIRQPLWLTK